MKFLQVRDGWIKKELIEQITVMSYDKEFQVVIYIKGYEYSFVYKIYADRDFAYSEAKRIAEEL